MAEVKLENVTKLYGKKKVIDKVSLSFADKSFGCILGPMGAGKTTLLRIIAGLEPLDEGTVMIGDKDVADLPPQKRRVAMVFQSYALYRHMTTYRNIANPLRVQKIAKEDIDKRVGEVAKFLKIEHLLDRKPDQVSGGEMQRIAIARAIVRDADVFLFDEPLTNLDYKIREDMRGELKRMREELGQTIVYATPDPVDALAMADKIAVINNGVIRQFDSVDGVYKKPVDSFVGAYVGNPPMNLFDCSIEDKQGRMILDAREFTIDATPIRTRLSAVPKTLSIGLRPEHMYLGRRGSTNEASFKADVIIGEVVGSDTIVHLKAGSLLMKVFVQGILRASPGEHVEVGFSLDSLYVFDKQDGKALM
jgi:multiple sugar transport system ATP-binding protein